MASKSSNSWGLLGFFVCDHFWILLSVVCFSPYIKDWKYEATHSQNNKPFPLYIFLRWLLTRLMEEQN